jgi:hypothetical protein
VALRDRWGIDATTADHVLPAWEVDLLLERAALPDIAPDGALEDEDEGPGLVLRSPDPFTAGPPDTLKDL